MKKVQVLVAAEHAPRRQLLADLAVSEPGVILAGEAANGFSAVALASRLKPDVVVLDTNLPYIAGFDDVRLSRIGGLDAALAIAEREPGTRVVLVNNLHDTWGNSGSSASSLALIPAKPKNGFAVQPSLRELFLDLTVGQPAFVQIIESAPARVGGMEARASKKGWGRLALGLVAGLLGVWALAGVVFLAFFLASIF